MVPSRSRCPKLWFAVPLIAALSGCSSSEGPSLLSKLKAAIGSETEPNATPASATAILGNRARLRAYASPAGDADYFRFTGSAGNRVYAATMTAGSSDLGDTILDLFDTDGTTLVEEDDDNGSFDFVSSSIAGAVLPRNGTFFLRVVGFGGSQIRPYDLYFRLQDVAGAPEVEPNNTAATAQPFPAGGFVDGALSSAADADFYSIALGAGDTVFLSLDLNPNRTGVSFQGRLGFGPFSGSTLLVDDPTGDLVPSEAFFTTVKSAGTYVILVDGGGGTTLGTYRLSATVFPRDTVGVNCVTYPSTDTPKLLPPGPSLTTSTITVPGNPRVADLTVSLGMNHSNPRDLDAQLTAPGGNTVDLFTNIGASAFPNVDVTLDQAAGIPIDSFTVMNNLVAQPPTQYRLSWFNGQPAGGPWRLSVYGESSSFNGTLNSFALRICEPAPLTCPTGASPFPLVSFDFEASAGGFTHSGTNDDWARGTPSAPPIDSCNGGTKCWKTNLIGAYSPNSTQDLVSPPIDLTNAGAPLFLSWAMKYQMESATFDHAWVEIQVADGSNPTRLWEWRDDSMIDAVGSVSTQVDEAAGWGVTTADVSAYTGQVVRLVFHLDSDGAAQLGGLAVDDISFNRCPAPVCGNGVLELGEQCDHGAATGTPGDCCAATTCQFAAPTVTCRASTGACDAAETCTGSSAVCPADAKAPNGTSCSDGNGCTQGDTCQSGTCTSGSTVTCTALDQCHVAGTCNPATGVCSNPTAPNGRPCNDGNACTQIDTCQAGACSGGNPVSCAPLDQCHVAGTCNPATGTCSNPSAANGTLCNDGNACTQGDTCQGGTCSGGSPVSCAPLDQCHVAGACNPATGACSNPLAPNGISCNDGNACTQTDTCQAGVCAGNNPVTCTPLDQCHVAGTCNPATGACSNPSAANGTSCNDGNACTQADACQSGTCTGTAVTCAPSDACHVAGTCNPATGVCSNPTAPNGTSCSDGNGCTQTDTCQSGLCTGGNPRTCTPLDQCHVAGTCNPATGACSNPSAPNGTSCDDGNACTQTDACQGGTCAGGNPVTCTPSDACHVAGTCSPATGTCSNPAAPNGTSCNDGDACTQTDRCQSGTCTGGNPVACAPSDACHVAGTCNPATGACSNPAAPDGTSCTDGDACTQTDTCQGGTCTGGNPVACTSPGSCRVSTCNPATGTCSASTVAPDGTSCSDGNGCTQNDTCQAGTCTSGNPVFCVRSDACHMAGTCDPATGTCSNPAAPDGMACNDGNACTQFDSCLSGTCTGGPGLNCDDDDACTADTCDRLAGCQHSGRCMPDAGGGGGGGGCGCAAAGAGSEGAFLLMAVVLVGVRRARRKR